MTPPFTVVYVWRQSRLGVSEGLNVLLTDMIRGLSSNGVSVRVLTTRRHVDGLHDVLEKNHIPVSNLELVELARGSRLLALKDRLLDWRMSRRKGGGASHPGRIWAALRGRISRFLRWGLDLTPLNSLFKLPALLSVGFLALAASPLLLAMYLARALVRRVLSALIRRVRTHVGSRFGWLHPANLLEHVYRRESACVGKAIDRAHDIPVVFIPSAFEGHLCSQVRTKRKLVVFPDATPLLFPTLFPRSRYANLLNVSMQESVRYADGLVCYSKFVRDMQLRKFFREGLEGKLIEVIPQGFFLDDEFGERHVVDDCELNKYLRNYFPEYGRVPKAYFGEFSLIIYPTVDRPHKNTLILLKAFEALLRERGRNIKLVLTSPGGTRETMDFIRDRKLHRDVLFMPAVPIVVLNALLEHASVMVHPSLAEGGDIFNFSRAVSHGTPALVADIPVAREMFERHGITNLTYGDWLFDATDDSVLAEKIDRILCNTWQPLAEQRATLERLSSYRFSDMARLYNDFFQRLVADSSQSKEAVMA